MTEQPRDHAAELEALYTDMALNHVEGLWRVERKGPDVRPHVWPWPVMERLVRESGRLVDIDRPGERRAVALCNPGLSGAIAATHNIYAAIQLVRPGELARAHRHTPSALRFIIKGNAASTIVEGEKVPMREGDLVLTPNWMWHEHRNEGTEDVIWLDGLDSPFVFNMAAAVYEPFPGDQMEVTKPIDYSGGAYGLGSVRPIDAAGVRADAPLLVYRWEAVRDALGRLDALGTSTPHDGVAIEYVGAAGGHALATIACWMQMLRPGEHTQAHRHTFGPVYHVLDGAGYTLVDGARFDWSKADTFVLPPWSWHEHVNLGDGPAYLFSMNDLPVLESFRLNREEAYAENDGRQRVGNQ